MPVARFLRLLLTLVVLMSGLVSALACGVVEGSPQRAESVEHGRVPQPASRASSRDAQIGRTTRMAGDVGPSTTSTTSNVVRSASRGSGGLLAALSRAMSDPPVDSSESEQDEFEVGDSPDLFDDDCPQGFVILAFPGLTMPRLAALSVEPNLWGIQPSIGHPQGDDEPPRV
jgi:hypothetical protein